MLGPDLIAKVREDLRQYVGGLVSRIVMFTRVSATSTDGSADGVEGWPANEGPQTQETVRRMEPWGLHGRAMAGVQALVARSLGGAASGLLAGIWTGAYGRQNLNAGETQLYGGKTATAFGEVFVDQNGAVYVNVATGQLLKLTGGTDFMLLGSTYRTGEHTFNGALQAYFAAMATAWTAMSAALTTLGNPVGAAAATVAATASTTAATAATAMEAGASSYLSTASKVG